MAEEASKEDILKCLEVMSSLPPHSAEKDLFRLTFLIEPNKRPDFEDKLFQKVDLPLKTKKCSKTGNLFIANDYNRDADSHRSPWSNEYEPAFDGLKPKRELRDLEIVFNKIFEVYKNQYFNKLGVSSVYCFELEKEGDFAVTLSIQKELKPSEKHPDTGTWNSTHVVSCYKQSNGNSFDYKCISTVLMNIDTGDEKLGTGKLSGSVSAENSRSGLKIDPENLKQSHVSNIGLLVEEAETELRNKVEGLYFGKCNAIFQSIRHKDAAIAGSQAKMANSMKEAMAKKLKKVT